MRFITPASAKLHSADDPWLLAEQTVGNSDKIRGTRLPVLQGKTRALLEVTRADGSVGR
jgi:hypothetical protein